MRPRLFAAVLASLTLFACQKHSDPAERPSGTAEPAAAPPAAAPTPGPAPVPPGQPPAGDQVIDREPVSGDPGRPPPATNGNETTAAGACRQDTDCPKGQVCESCGAQSECTPGCHRDDQCGPGERCSQVQCIRCPCPGQCEAGPAEEGRGKL